ncbi:hypothetical protein J437_LFUL006396 [Ladona fulva]|uniref:PH domain-containing protein n=1 Tax=Ladona fulva TaxID=123851 RepID=A0A8K0K0Q2_LADFU|nr:hypothetical protein J437_LFUL006396 [Ladona fulva]
MLGTPVCDELRGYLDVKVPSVSRKKGLLINLKAWRRRWLVVRRFLVSSPLAMDEGAILGRRIELKLTGDDSGNSAAPCPVVVVEEWQEDALVCPTKSRSHPYAFGLFPQPGCDPVLFLSGRTAEESRRWLVSIRSLLVPPFRPCSYRLSSISSSTGEDVDGPFHHSSPLSSSPETYQSRCVPRSRHVCFPPLPPLPSRCKLRRRSSLESLSAPFFLMDRRRSLSDSELPNSTVSEHRHHRRKCQTISSKAIDADTSRNEYLMEDYDHHIYAGIGDSGVCSSMSNVSRSFLSSSSSSSCSSSSGLYTYASPSSSGFTSYLRGNELEVVPAETSSQVSSKGDDPSLLTGKVCFQSLLKSFIEYTEGVLKFWNS